MSENTTTTRRLALTFLLGAWSTAALGVTTYYVQDGYVTSDESGSYGSESPNYYTSESQPRPRKTAKSASSKSRSASSNATSTTPSAANADATGSSSQSQPQAQQVSHYHSNSDGSGWDSAGNTSGYTWDSSYQTQSATSGRSKSLLRRLLPGNNQQTNVAPQATGPQITGLASWYGKGFHGGKTANGERYDMNSMTAAHKSLPFGTIVKVTNVNNGRECVVRINNRGPYIRGRVLDLSRAAANELGMVNRGVARVSMQILGRQPKNS